MIDLTLSPARNKVVVHGNVCMHTIGTSLQNKYPRPIVMEMSSSKEHYEMIALKKKYEPFYPGLKNVNDNLWEIIDYFIHNEIVMSREDIDRFANIINRSGMELPDLNYLACHIKKFLEGLGRTFNF